MCFIAKKCSLMWIRVHLDDISMCERLLLIVSTQSHVPCFKTMASTVKR